MSQTFALIQHITHFPIELLEFDGEAELSLKGGQVVIHLSVAHDEVVPDLVVAEMTLLLLQESGRYRESAWARFDALGRLIQGSIQGSRANDTELVSILNACLVWAECDPCGWTIRQSDNVLATSK